MEKDLETEVRKLSEENIIKMSVLEAKIKSVREEINEIKEELNPKVYTADHLFIRKVEYKPKIDNLDKNVFDIKTKNVIMAYTFEPETNVKEMAASIKLGIINVTSEIHKEKQETLDTEKKHTRGACSFAANTYQLPEGSKDMSHIWTVELAHDANSSLELSIASGIGSPFGDTPIVVASLTPAGPAEKSRKLKVGDKILSINGVSTEGMNHEQVVNLLKSSKDSITLKVTQGEQTQVSVCDRSSSTRGSTRGSPSGFATPKVAAVRTPTPRGNSVFEDEYAPPQYKSIDLERGPDGLGFSIVGGHGSPDGDLPICVNKVFSKKAASANGQLKRGDQIHSVNGSSLEGLTHDEAVKILKNAKGSVIMSVLSLQT